jgi:hypothetical protein
MLLHDQRLSRRRDATTDNAFRVLTALTLLTGCAAIPIPGGKLVRNYHPKVMIAYQAEGDVEPGTRHFLVQEKAGPAFFEQSSDGKGTVLERHWADAAGDHFATWASPGEPGEAVEVLIPLDRSQPAYRFVYAPGLYQLRNDDGADRPTPKMLIEASAMLRPLPAP